MGLYDVVRAGRFVINGNTEYKVRRGLYRAMPIKQHCGANSLWHACLPKTASQFVRVVLSDPSVYRRSGMLPFACDAGTAESQIIGDYRGRCLLLNVVRKSERLEGLLNGARGIYVDRDPMELFISWYTSQRYSHPDNPGVLDFRRRVEGLSDTGAMRVALDDFVYIYDIIRSWLVVPECFIRVRYENVTGEGALDEWERIMGWFDIEIDRERLGGIVDRYRDLIFGGEANLSRKYSFDKSGVRDAFERDIKSDWLSRYGSLYSEGGVYV